MIEAEEEEALAAEEAEEAGVEDVSDNPHFDIKDHSQILNSHHSIQKKE
jgi:hypothetical protein